MTTQEIKQLFFTYRNGMLADTLRRNGYPHKVIFGLNVPQIAEISRRVITETTKDELKRLASDLWDDPEVRESRLLASYLFPRDSIAFEEALKLARECRTPEEADMLAFRLLKHLPFADSLLIQLKAEKEAGLAAKSLEAHLS